jgi:hypothetical protein
MPKGSRGDERPSWANKPASAPSAICRISSYTYDAAAADADALVQRMLA